VALIGPTGLFPLYASGQYTIPSISNQAIDASNDGVAWVFLAPTTGPLLTKAAVRCGALTGSAPTYVLSIQGVAAGGVPDGTVKGGASPVSVEITPASGDAGKVKEYTFDNSYDSAPGEYLALCIRPKAGTTVDGSNNWSFTRYASGVSGIPYTVLTNTGTNSLQYEGTCFGVSDGTNWWGLGLVQAATYVATDGNPVCAGNLITLPAGMGDTVRCIGLWEQLVYTSGTQTLKLYDSADNLLADIAIPYTGGYSIGAVAMARFDSAAVTLTCGQTYRAVVSVGRVNYVDVGAVGHWDIFSGGSAVQWTQGNTGAWTETATRRAMCGLLIDDVTELAAAALTDPPA
jgi:hypothetical protein